MTDEAGSPAPLAPPAPPAPPALPAPPPPTREPLPAELYLHAPAPPQPPPSPLATLPQSASGVLAASFDLLVVARNELRRGSLYIGLVLLLTVGPLVLLLWGFIAAGNDLPDELASPRDVSPADAAQLAQLVGPMLVTGLLATVGLIITAVEGQAVAVAVLGSHLAGQPLTLRAALMRSRVVFWRLVRAALVVGIPLSILGFVIQAVLGVSQGAQLVVTFAETLAGAPFVYLAAGIVIGDVGALEAVRRSFRLAGARRKLALMVSFFAALAGYLLLFGLGAGADLIARLVEPLGLGPEGGLGAAVAIAAVAAVFIVALGTLQFTVLAIATAPQVVTFLALTQYTGGLEWARVVADAVPVQPSSPIGPDGRATYWSVPPPPIRFRWLTMPLLLGVVIGLITMVVGIAQAANT